jgi:hypothetical protein
MAIVGLVACGVAICATPAGAALYLPPPGKLFAGVGPSDPVGFELETQSHLAVLEDYIAWNNTYAWLLYRADRNHMRPMVALMPNFGQHLYFTMHRLSLGAGDAWLMQLGQALAARGRPTYVRIMAEMNGWWNPYCAFNSSGNKRRGNSTRDFRQAWRRIVLILRGGSVSQVDARLHRLHMPPVRVSTATLPQAPVSFVWNPQTVGSPAVRGNSAKDYYPGGAYVDWVGTDTFSRFPNWAGLERFYRTAYPRKPFAIGEWGLWGGDAPRWTRRFVRWVSTHRRVRMVVYYQDYPPGPFDIGRFPRSRGLLRAWLRGAAFAPEPPEWNPLG